jgi:hypothetical protein
MAINTDKARLTGNYRFAEFPDAIRPGLVLEVQLLLDGASCKTEWITAYPEDLMRLVEQVSGGEQEVVTVTNLRRGPTTSRLPGHGASYTAYAVREKLPEDPLFDDGPAALVEPVPPVWHTPRQHADGYDDGTYKCTPCYYRLHNPYQPYAVQDFKPGVIGNVEPYEGPNKGDMRIVKRHRERHSTSWYAEIRGDRGWYPIVMGNIKGSQWLFETSETAMAIALGTHAVMSAKGDF